MKVQVGPFLISERMFAQIAVACMGGFRLPRCVREASVPESHKVPEYVP